MIIEVIATTVQDVKDAEKFGADRIELCLDIKKGGLTPSYELIKAVVKSCDIPVNVMVRPHARSFVYDKKDTETMLHDIEFVKKSRANGIVIGPLTPQGKIDEESLQTFLEAAEGLDVTFHRAFDYVEDQLEALECLLRYKQITTILTAGGKGFAAEQIPDLKKFISYAKDTHLTIMPGHGLRTNNIKQLVEKLNPQALHFGSGVRVANNFELSLDKDKIKQLKCL